MAPAKATSRSFYETDQALAEYLLFHYGKSEDILPYSFGPHGALGFPVRCVVDCFDFSDCPTGSRALDLGCAVGRSTFELARHCSEAIGIDFSSGLIAAAQEIQRSGHLEFKRTTEAEVYATCEAILPENIDRSRASFMQGDAMKMQPTLGSFDFILCANLIDRLPDPARFLHGLIPYIKPGGQLVITSPYTWLEAYTPRQNWLNAETGDSFDGLHSLLKQNMTLLNRQDLPFLIREHNRKYQWSVADATTWKRTE